MHYNIIIIGRDGLRVRCSYINYFNLDDQDEPSPTRSILASVRRATVFPLCSLLLLLIGGIICFVGHCHTRKIILTFISGVMFVLAGLCTLVGLILYIGSITGEGGSKSMPGPTDKQPKFIYHYGSSFMMAVGSFSLTELAGVFSVYLYISRYKHLQMTEQKNTVVTQLNDKSNQWRHRRSRSQSRDRPQSRDGSVSRSESYFTYTPVSETSHELSNYTFPREVSRNTISTTAETHVIKEQSVHSVDTIRRTTPV